MDRTKLEFFTFLLNELSNLFIVAITKASFSHTGYSIIGNIKVEDESTQDVEQIPFGFVRLTHGCYAYLGEEALNKGKDTEVFINLLQKLIQKDIEVELNALKR